jgi:hypothetical protein
MSAIGCFSVFFSSGGELSCPLVVWVSLFSVFMAASLVSLQGILAHLASDVLGILEAALTPLQ